MAADDRGHNLAVSPTKLGCVLAITVELKEALAGPIASSRAKLWLAKLHPSIAGWTLKHRRLGGSAAITANCKSTSSDEPHWQIFYTSTNTLN